MSEGKHTITHSGTGRFHMVTGDANGDSGRYFGLSANHTADASFGSIAELEQTLRLTNTLPNY